jgi:formate hydrogenlyase transcriptional activator
MPVGLLESELFGYERGAFTGALNQTTGRFQLACGGTLFLDEIGELPLELQPKLLRALQEKEIERLGGGRTIRVDVRIVAATNQNLARQVSEGKFRADLFYRLNVFPVSMPPLRQRVDDIPLLVKHFMERAGHRMRKEVCLVPETTMRALLQHPWPGNVRELQNVIERAVIVSSDGELRIPAGCFETFPATDSPALQRTLAEAEREHIVGTLRATRGVVGGKHGAAARLGIPRTTLLAKMQKLGIVTGDVPDAHVLV